MRVQITGEVAQDGIGIVVVVIDQGGEVALGVEHGAAPFVVDEEAAAALSRRGRMLEIRRPAGR